MIGKVTAAAALLAAAPTTAHAQLRPYAVAEAGAERRQALPDGEPASAVPDAFPEPGRGEGFAYGLALGADRAECRRLETDDGYDPERLVAGLQHRF